MRTLFFIILFAGLWACNPPAATPTEPAPPAVAQNESGEPMAATDATIVAAPTTFCSYHLVTAFGAREVIGTTFLQSKAWQMPTAGEPADNTLFLRDLIAALERDGMLSGIDLTKTAANRLQVLWPGSSPRKGWILKSWELPQPPK